MSNTGGWDAAASRVYYIAGGAYYVTHWIGLLGGVGAIASGFLSARLGMPLACASGVACIVAGRMWLHSFRQRLAGSNPGLRVQSMEVGYRILRARRYRSTRRVCVKARRDGVDHFAHKFLWTGSGTLTPAVSSPANATISIEKDPHTVFHVCRVYLARPLRRSETVVFDYHIDLEDEEGTSRPYVAMTTHDPMQELTLFVEFDHDRPSRIRRQLFLSGVAEIPMFEDTGGLSGSAHRFEWKITRPRMYWRYRLVWDAS